MSLSFIKDLVKLLRFTGKVVFNHNDVGMEWVATWLFNLTHKAWDVIITWQSFENEFDADNFVEQWQGFYAHCKQSDSLRGVVCWSRDLQADFCIEFFKHKLIFIIQPNGCAIKEFGNDNWFKENCQWANVKPPVPVCTPVYFVPCIPAPFKQSHRVGVKVEVIIYVNTKDSSALGKINSFVSYLELFEVIWRPLSNMYFWFDY